LISVQPVIVDRAVVHSREDDLITNDSPRSPTLVGFGELVVKPVLLEASHQRTTGIVLEIFNVVIVPVKRRDRPVIVACVEHDEVKELSHLEITPDPKIVVHVDLANTVLDISIVKIFCSEIPTASIRSKLARRSFFSSRH